MVGLVTSEFRVLNAKQFVEMFSETEDNIYFFAAKNTPWTTPTNTVSDNNPPAPSDAKFDLREIWKEMIALKRVLSSDVSLGLHRYDWVHGTKYDSFDDRDSLLHYKKWYVITSQSQVFACLNNGRVLDAGMYSGAPSTYEPFYDPANPGVTLFNTPDGYVWKYMYTVTPGNFLKFSTPSWIPCPSGIFDSAKISGIYSIILSDFGIGYSSGDCVVTITGDGTGATAVPVIVGGQITKINITNPGTGYTQASVTITGTNTTPASARPITFGRKGFGVEPAVDLAAYFVISSITFQYGEGGVIPTYNEYRTFGFIRNPEVSSNVVATGTIYNMIYRLRVTSDDLFNADDVVSVNGGTAMVIEYDTSDPANKYLTLGSITTNITVGDTISLDIRTASVLEVLDSPDLQPHSGDILYVENSSPIYRSANQSELFILVSEL